MHSSSPLLLCRQKKHTLFLPKRVPPPIKPTNEAAGQVLPAAVKVEPIVSPTVLQPPLKEKGISIKKELLSGTPTPMDVENPLARLSSIGEDKPLSPMQTPQPTSSGQPLSANLHIIVQQRNEAVDSLLATGIVKSTELKLSLPAATTTVYTSATTTSTHKPIPPISKQHPLPSTTVPPLSTAPVIVSSISRPVLPPPAPPKTQPQISVAPKTQPQNSSVPKTQPLTISGAPKTQIQSIVTPKTQAQSTVSMTFLPPARASPQSQPSLSTHLPKPVSIMTYLSKTPNVSQPHKGGMLQSLVSTSSSSLLSAGGVHTVSSSATTGATPLSITTSAVASVTASRVPSPLVSRNTPVASLIRMSVPTSIAGVLSSSLQAPKPPVVTSQLPTVAPSISSIGALQPSIRAAVTTPVTIQKVVDSHPLKIPSKVTPVLPDTPLKKPPQTVSVAATKEEVTVKSSKPEGIKTLLTLPPSAPRQPVKVEVFQEAKKPTEQEDSSSTIRQEASVAQSPPKVEATPTEVEPENKQVRHFFTFC